MTTEAETPGVETEDLDIGDDVSFTLAMEGEEAELMAAAALDDGDAESDREFDVDISEESELTAAELADAADESIETWAEESDGAEASGDAEDVALPDEAFAEAADETTRAPLAFALDTDAVAEQVRMLECLLFAAAEPLDIGTLAARLPADADVPALLEALQARMQGRGVELVKVANGWRLQTPADLAWLLEDVREERRKLSAAARETLAIIAYHQPVTRAEVEEIRGVAVSKGTVDMLMELGWVRMRGRRRAPGRPVTYGTTDLFLSHFGLEALTDLPGKAELKAAGLLDSRLPADFTVPEPGLFDTSNEDPLEDAPAEAAEFHVDFIDDAEQDVSADEAPIQARAS